MRLWKDGHSQPRGSQRQNVGVGCFSYSFGQSHYHHTAEEPPRVAVMLESNLHVIQYACTGGVDAAWKKVHPLQDLSLADTQPRSLLQQEPDGGGAPASHPKQGYRSRLAWGSMLGAITLMTKLPWMSTHRVRPPRLLKVSDNQQHLAQGKQEGHGGHLERLTSLIHQIFKN